MIFRKIIVGLAMTALAGPALAGSNLPLVTQSGQTRQLPSGTTLAVQPSTTGAASLNIPAGTAPSSPANGDCWTTTAGYYCQINGTTVGPYVGGANSPIFTAGLSGTITSPSFATGTYNSYHVFNLNSTNYQALYNAQQAGYNQTDAVTVAFTVPGSAANHQANGLSIIGSSQRGSYIGGGGDVAAYIQMGCTVAGCNAFALNPLLYDTNGISGQHLQNEFDFNVFDGRTSVAGLSLVLNSTQTFSGGGGANGYMCRIANTTQWGACYWSYDGASPIAFIVGALGTGNNVYSQDLQFTSRSSGGTTYTSSIRSDPNGSLLAKPGVAGGAIGFQDFGGSNIGFINSAGLSVTPTSGAGGVTVTSGSATGTTPLTLQNNSNASVTTKTLTVKAQGLDTISTVKDVATRVVTPIDVNWVDSTESYSIRVADSVTRRLALSAAGVTIDRAALLPGYTVSTLPTCNSGMTGALAYVSDATTPTYNATLTGGGAVKIPVFCNGTAWTAH